MSYRPPDWKGWKRGSLTANSMEGVIYEAGADDMLEAQQPLLNQVYAQLCGIRLKYGKSEYKDSLDDSIEKLKQMIRPIGEELPTKVKLSDKEIMHKLAMQQLTGYGF